VLLSVLLSLVVAASVGAGAPSIEITYVPAYGTSENLRGRVRGVDLAAYHVAVHLFLEGVGWYVKPTLDAPCTTISPSGDFEVDVTTGGYDALAHRYAVFLLPVGDACPAVSGEAFLPASLLSWPSDFVERTPYALRFSGHTWVRRNSPYPGGPSDNCFSPENAAVDEQGRLHLRLTFARCADEDRPVGGEVSLARSLGYGEYRIHTTGRVDALHLEAVLGMFTWDPDGEPWHREMDTELSRWGEPAGPNAQFVIQPFSVAGNRERFTIVLAEDESDLTFLLHWTPGRAAFAAYRGHHLGTPPPGELVHQKEFTSGVPVPGAERFRLNLWRYCAAACGAIEPQEVVVAYFGHTAEPFDFYSLSPCRLVDTRGEPGRSGGPPVAANADRTFRVVGTCGIPSTARAVSLNVTVVDPTAAGHLRLYPAGDPLPSASTINYSPGQTRANNAIVGVGDHGEIAAYGGRGAGTVHLVLDVNGYFE
jgi:hypothetical protein